MPISVSAEQFYLDGLLQAYEAEMAGEVYFTALCDVFPEPSQQEKLVQLAKVEHRTWTILLPLIERHRLKPLDRPALAARGEYWVTERALRQWRDLMTNMTTRYPGFIEKFKALEAEGPDEDKPALNVLVRHEAALLAFAEHELAGAADSLLPIRDFLTDTQSTSGRAHRHK
ncbi:MAG: hypothetical protein O3B21_03265 [Proteobacteria bacterium]|nr:hypothetical protein [Pseudomonadota bacterium]MDA1357008.1 hypothetical protein [Pseudomonadota bacterium]